MNPRIYSLLCAAGSVAVAAGFATADLNVAPDTIIFHDRADEAIINVSSNGAELPASAFTRATLQVEDFSYDGMLDVSAEKGRIKIRPTDSLEPGVYSLHIETSEGPARIRIYAPLRELASDITAQSQTLNLSRDAALGAFAENAVTVPMNFPSVVYTGQQVDVPTSTPESRKYVWLVNGNVVAQGFGPHTFSFVFDSPDTYVVAYLEQEKGRVVASGTQTVLVTGEPPRPYVVAVGEPFTLTAPAGFADYTWTLDGVELPIKTQVLEQRFDLAGEREIRVLARNVDPAGPDAFRTITFRVRVVAATD